MKHFIWLIAVLVLSLVLAACAGAGESTSAPVSEPAASSEEETSEEETSQMEETEGALQDILLYHVIGSGVPAESVVALDSADTVQGEPVAIAVEEE